MAQLPTRSVTWVTLSWIHSSLYPSTFSFSTSGATPSHSKIRPGSLRITWIFCGVLLGADSRGQNTITLCMKTRHYPHWKWLKRQFHPLSWDHLEESMRGENNFCKSQVEKIRLVSICCFFPRPQECQRANGTEVQHAEAPWLDQFVYHASLLLTTFDCTLLFYVRC